MDSECERSISTMTIDESENTAGVETLQYQPGSTKGAERLTVNPAGLEQSGIGSFCVKLKLYSYWRSSCSWRVRIALNLKGLPYEYEAVNLLEGKQFSEDYTKLNPLQFVPTLVDGDIVISDSLAILLYLEEKYPKHPLLPDDLRLKAINLQVAGIVGSNIQPFQNMSMLKKIEAKLGPEERLGWVQHFIEKGLAALEKLLEGIAGKYCTGDKVSLADVYLVPQFASAARFSVNTSQFPTLKRINEALEELPAFQAALPTRQPDAKNIVN